MILVAIFTLGLPRFSLRLARVVLGTRFWDTLLPLWRHSAPDVYVSVTLLGGSHALMAESPHGGVTATANMMDVSSVVLLALLTGLIALVWWCGWQRRPRWPRQSWRAWLRSRLWWYLAGLYSAVWTWVWHLHRWAQRRPLRVHVDTWLEPPCVLCGDARHTTQEHVRLPQQELKRRGGDDGC
jgi:hypothetical protein